MTLSAFCYGALTVRVVAGGAFTAAEIPELRSTRAAAVPEVVRQGILVAPDDVDALADGIWKLWRDPTLRDTVAQRRFINVEQYEIMRIARLFLGRVEQVKARGPA